MSMNTVIEKLLPLCLATGIPPFPFHVRASLYSINLSWNSLAAASSMHAERHCRARRTKEEERKTHLQQF